MSTQKAATEICSAMEYLVDRGEVADITDVETSVRYTDKTISEFVVVCEGRRIKFTAKDIGEAEIEEEEEEFEDEETSPPTIIQLQSFGALMPPIPNTDTEKEK